MNETPAPPGLSRPWAHGDVGLPQTVHCFTHIQHGEGVGAKGQEALEQPLEGAAGQAGNREAQRRLRKTVVGQRRWRLRVPGGAGDRAQPGTSPRRTVSGVRAGCSPGTTRPRPPPCPAKGRGEDTPRRSLRAGHGFKDSRPLRTL